MIRGLTQGCPNYPWMIQRPVVFMSFMPMNFQFSKLGCRSQFVLECPICRPEGPEANRPGRKAGNKVACEMSAEGAAHNEILECRAFSAHSVVYLFPGLTAGPISFRPFGPQIVKANLDKLEAK
jgi:hypothetical protein